MRKVWLVLVLLTVFGCGIHQVLGVKVDHKCDRDVWRVWEGLSCFKGDPARSTLASQQPAAGPSVCMLGLNNNLCQLNLTEDSVWGGDERSPAAAQAVAAKYRAFYKFTAATQTWEHYLFITVPYMDKPIYEYRTGTFELHEGVGDYVDMKTTASSCTGQEAIFGLFDATPRNIFVGRSDKTIQLRISAELTAAEGVKVEKYKEHFFGAIFTFMYDLLLTPFTPEFWQSVVTGPYSYKDTTKTDLDAALAGATKSCFSVDGIKGIQDKVQVPDLVKQLLNATGSGSPSSGP